MGLGTGTTAQTQGLGFGVLTLGVMLEDWGGVLAGVPLGSRCCSRLPEDPNAHPPHLGVQGHLGWPLILSPSLGQTMWSEGQRCWVSAVPHTLGSPPYHEMGSFTLGSLPHLEKGPGRQMGRVESQGREETGGGAGQ